MYGMATRMLLSNSVLAAEFALDSAASLGVHLHPVSIEPDIACANFADFVDSGGENLSLVTVEIALVDLNKSGVEFGEGESDGTRGSHLASLSVVVEDGGGSCGGWRGATHSWWGGD